MAEKKEAAFLESEKSESFCVEGGRQTKIGLNRQELMLYMQVVEQEIIIGGMAEWLRRSVSTLVRSTRVASNTRHRNH